MERERRRDHPKRSFRRCRQRGSVAVEFAIVLVPFMFVLIGIFETALIMYTESIISARAAFFGRLVRTGQFVGTTPAEVKTFFCSSSFVPECSSRLRLHITPLQAGTALPDAIGNDNKYALGSDKFDTGHANDIVIVRFFYEYSFIHAGVREVMKNLDSGKRLIESTTAFRAE